MIKYRFCVVKYNHLTKKFELDEDTLWSRFSGGRVYSDNIGWHEPDSESELGKEIGVIYDTLNHMLNKNSTSVLSINEADVKNDKIESKNLENLSHFQLAERASVLGRED